MNIINLLNSIKTSLKMSFNYLNQRSNMLNRRSKIMGSVLILILILVLISITKHQQTVVKFNDDLNKSTYKNQSLKERSIPIVQADNENLNITATHIDHALSMNTTILRSLLSTVYQIPTTLTDIRDKLMSFNFEKWVKESNNSFHDTKQQLSQLQLNVKQLIYQKNKVKNVDPILVEKYFTLAGIQGFSDGLRAVLMVSGHPMILALHDTCAVCHGWYLQRMIFSAQSATFQKNQQFVTLQAK